MSSVLKVRETYEGKVTDVRPHGVYLDVLGERVLVLVPDISWSPAVDPLVRYRVGDTEQVKILAFVADTSTFKGSIKAAREANPYERLAGQIGSSFVVTVKSASDRAATVVLENGLWAALEFPESTITLRLGDRVQAALTTVQVSTEELVVEFVDLLDADQ